MGLWSDKLISMKKSKIIFAILVLFTVSIYGREFPSVNNICFVPKVSDKSYMQTQDWKRYKMFKALGWGTLATGFVTANAGFWWSVSMYEGDYPEKRKKTAGGICYSGLFLIGASIPCFILSHVCKENAILSVGGGNIIAPLPCGSVEYRPAVALRISF